MSGMLPSDFRRSPRRRFVAPVAQPGDTRYNLAFFGVDKGLLPLAIGLALWRLAYRAFALVGFLYGMAAGDRTQKLSVFLGVLFLTDYLSNGPITDARFFVFDATLLAPLAAAGMFFLRTFFTRFGAGSLQERGATQGQIS